MIDDHHLNEEGASAETSLTVLPHSSHTAETRLSCEGVPAVCGALHWDGGLPSSLCVVHTTCADTSHPHRRPDHTSRIVDIRLLSCEVRLSCIWLLHWDDRRPSPQWKKQLQLRHPSPSFLTLLTLPKSDCCRVKLSQLCAMLFIGVVAYHHLYEVSFSSVDTFHHTVVWVVSAAFGFFIGMIDAHHLNEVG